MRFIETNSRTMTTDALQLLEQKLKKSFAAMRTISPFCGYLIHILDRIYKTVTLKFMKYTTYK